MQNLDAIDSIMTLTENICLSLGWFNSSRTQVNEIILAQGSLSKRPMWLWMSEWTNALRDHRTSAYVYLCIYVSGCIYIECVPLAHFKTMNGNDRKTKFSFNRTTHNKITTFVLARVSRSSSPKRNSKCYIIYIIINDDGDDNLTTLLLFIVNIFIIVLYAKASKLFYPSLYLQTLI